MTCTIRRIPASRTSARTCELRAPASLLHYAALSRLLASTVDSGSSVRAGPPPMRLSQISPPATAVIRAVREAAVGGRRFRARSAPPSATRTHDTRPPSPRTGPRQTAARQHHQRRALRAVAEDLTRTPRIRPPPQARKRRRERDTTTELPSSRSSPLTGRRAWIAPALARRRSPAPDRVNYNLGNHGYSGASRSDLTLSDRSFQPHRGVFAEPPTQERGQGRRSAASDPGRFAPATCTTMYCRPSWR